MSKSVNKVTLLGRLGKDPEMKFTQAGTAYCKISIATEESYTDKQGNKVEQTEWHNITIWDKLGEIASKYLTKGKQVYLEGKLKTSAYEKNGEKRYSTEVVCNRMVLLGSKDDNQVHSEPQPSKADTKDNWDNTSPQDDNMEVPF